MNDKFEVSEKNVLLVATAAPAISYWLAYLFKYGFCQRLNIPTDFIDIGLTDILFFIFLLIVFVLYSSIVFELFHGLRKGVPEIVKSKLRLTLFPAILFGILLFTYRINSSIIIYAGLSIVFIIFFIEFILPIFSTGKSASYISKLEEAQRKDFAYDSPTDELAKKIGFNNYSYLFTLAKISVLSLFLGSFYGYNKSEFLVSNNGDEIVLMRYKDYFVTAKYDSARNTYESKLRIVGISDLSGFTQKEIKNLKEK